MRRSIDASVLKALREEKGWSLDDLSRRAKVHRQTIYRLEHGQKQRTRQGTIERLSKALKVDEAILVGEVPRESQSSPDEVISERQQVNIRLLPQTRNALGLMAKRYGVSALQIVELAPFLFLLAAERCLQSRQERLSQMWKAIEALENCPTQPHLPYGSASVGLQDALSAEEDSISKRDLFGKIVDNSEAFFGPSERHYDPAEHNPFAMFLKSEVARLEIDAKFESIHQHIGPHYRIGMEEALALVGGDSDAAEAIIDGIAALHEMRKELGTEANPEQLAEWAKRRAADRARELCEFLGLIDSTSSAREAEQ